MTVSGRRVRGSAEFLNHKFAGVRRALWQYWATRSPVKAEHLRAYMETYGTNGYFRVIMWHLLPVDNWIELWTERRALRRAELEGEVLLCDTSYMTFSTLVSLTTLR